MSSGFGSDQLSRFTFTENGFVSDATRLTMRSMAFSLVIESGTCAVDDHASLLFFLQPWVVQTVNHGSSWNSLPVRFHPGGPFRPRITPPMPVGAGVVVNGL